MMEISAVALIFTLSAIVTYLAFHFKRKSDLYDRQLKNLGQMSEENRALLSILFHDLGTPLSVLEFSARRLAKTTHEGSEDSSVREKDIQKIQQSLSYMKDVLGKVRSLQEVRSGKRNLNLESVNPVEITKELIALLEDRLNEKNISIQIESYLGDHDTVQADRALLKNEVLANILSNAIKFSPRNRIIEIVFLRENDNDTLIQVRDFGIGIPGEMIPRLFDYTAKTSRRGTENEAGTGFGLPLAKTCTQLMSGTIEVESFTYEPGISGSGTAFNLRFKSGKSLRTAI